MSASAETAPGRASPSGGQDSSRAFSLQVIIGLVVVGVLSFAAFIVLNAFADDLRKPDDGGTHALSKSAVGFAGLVSLLEGDGRYVRLSRGTLQEASAQGQLTVLTPGLGRTVEADEVSGAWAGVLIVLPKWDTWPDFQHPGWVRSDGLANSTLVERVLEELDDGFTVGQAPGAKDVVLKYRDSVNAADIDAGRIERLQTMVSADITPLITDADGHAVLGLLSPDYGVNIPVEPPVADPIQDPVTAPPTLEDTPDDAQVDLEDHAVPNVEETASGEEEPDARLEPEMYGGAPIYVLSEPDLLNTKGLSSAITAQAGLQVFAFVAPDGAPVSFDMTLHGMERSRNLLKLMFEPPFLPAVLCLAFAGGLMAVNAVAGQMRVRSGREIALGKATLVENSALLVSLAGRDVRMGKRYAAMTRALAATAVGVPSRSTEAQQTAMLDAAGRQAREEKFSDLAAKVAEAKTRAAMTDAANRLFRWRQEIGREHRRR